MASKVVGKKRRKALTHLYTERMRRKAERILADGSQPLSNQFKLLVGEVLQSPLDQKCKKSFTPNAFGKLANSVFWKLHFLISFIFLTTSFCYVWHRLYL